MDPITHGLVGAASAQWNSDESQFRLASIIGFLSAMAADLDVLFRSENDPLLTLELHRHFSHSLFFIPIGSLIVSLVIWWFVKNKLTFKQTYLYSFAGYATAGLMDLITSYGVHIFWPIVDDRFSLNIISVFDPLFTSVLLIIITFSFLKKQKRYTKFASIWLIVYLSFCCIQYARVSQNAMDHLKARSIHPAELIIKPTIANQLLWSIRFPLDGKICAMGVRASLFSTPKIYEGECADLIDPENDFNSFKSTTLIQNIQRFSDLSDGFITFHPDLPNVIGDARYSMLPTTIKPIWGIVIDTTQVEKPIRFESFRDNNAETRTVFMNMVLGKE